MMFDYAFNPNLNKNPDWSEFEFLNNSDMLEFHKSLAGYKPTPLKSLPKLAAKLGLKEILVKDESERFGIKAFKALGASYAIYRYLKGVYEAKFDDEFTPASFKDKQALAKLGAITFTAATDGNHGRAVAWTANRLKQKAVIYMPSNTAQSRIENIESENAKVVLVAGSFDDCVAQCAKDAKANGWVEIADTAYPGYMEIPKYIMLGYSSILYELEPSPNKPKKPDLDFVFAPAGVGGIAAAITSYYVKHYQENGPKIICVEPSDSDCYLASIKANTGKPISSGGAMETMMVGLACDIPSLVAWPIIKDGIDFFMNCPDQYAIEAMRAYHAEGITSGESGSAGLAALLALFDGKEAAAVRQELGMNADSRILLINTEGDTDPINYKKIIES